MRHNVGFKVDAGPEEGDEDGGMVNTGGGPSAEEAEGEWGAKTLGPGAEVEEGGAPEQWTPTSLQLEVGGGDAEEDVADGSPHWGATRL